MACAGTVAAHVAAGDRVVMLWLTRGEMSAAYPDLSPDQVAERRVASGHQAAGILGAEARFLDMPDTRVQATPDTARTMAGVVADVRPDAVVTWGDAWARGMRHPDHQATGKIVRDAITLARIGGVVAPMEPHREPAPVFTLRAQHSTLPRLTVDVTDHVPTILELAAFYRGEVGWPPEGFMEDRLRWAGGEHELEAAEAFDAWETPPGLAKGLL
jgi:LmbE family N-acetylglucosaminyl deacetylase